MIRCINSCDVVIYKKTKKKRLQIGNNQIMNIYNSITDLIGKTPLLRLSGISKYYSLDESLIGKVESFNPAGSVKDRIAKAMILDGFKKGLINKDTVIIEPTSGNTGIGLASVTASLGLKLVIVMP